MKKITKALMASTLMVFFLQSLNCQDTTKINIDDFYIDFSVPDIGAFTLLNIKPDNITTPGNTKEFAASLLNVVSGGSSISPGIAIDWAPIQTFCKTTNPNEYKQNYLLRNLQLTLGTVYDSSGTRASVGFKWTFIDHTDPLLDNNLGKELIYLHHETFVDIAVTRNQLIKDAQFLLDKIQKNKNIQSNPENYLRNNNNIMDLFNPDTSNSFAKMELPIYYDIVVEKIVEELTIMNKKIPISLSDKEKNEIYIICLRVKKINESSEKYDKDYSADFNKTKKKWLNEHWNATVVTFGAGWVGNSVDSKWSTLYTQLFKSYLNGKFKVTKRTQAIGIVSFGIPNNKSINDSTIVSQLFFGGRFLVGNARNRFSIDLGYNSNFANTSSFNNNTIIANLGVEFKLDQGIFLEIAEASVVSHPILFKIQIYLPWVA